MAENQILPFAVQDTGTNLLTQAEYAADAQRLAGHQPGVARSKLENKALRQVSTMAAGLAQFIADGQSEDVTDSKTPAGIAALLSSALSSELFPAATNEYVIFKNGLVLQWGKVTRAINNTNQDVGTIALPIAITPMCCLTTQLQSSVGYPWCITASINGTQINYRALYTNAVQNTTTTIGFQWLAVGIIQ